jgi:DNA-binding beta-propeller fold protein YncE
VGDYANNRIQKFTSNGIYLTQWGSAGLGQGQFANPNYLAVDSLGNVYVVDRNNSRIEVFAP